MKLTTVLNNLSSVFLLTDQVIKGTLNNDEKTNKLEVPQELADAGQDLVNWAYMELTDKYLNIKRKDDED